MDNLLTIALEAHSDERNHHRRYVVTVGRDLLGDWTVTVRYGRAGNELRSLRFAGTDEGEMQRLVHERLRRRLSAERRIGCAYRPREISAVPGLPLGEWVPASIVASLFGGVRGRATVTQVPVAPPLDGT
jgi:predicted DNA-binding WGR domain protein